MNFDKEKCDEWQKARLATSPMNPFTNRHVKKDGPTFKKIDLICKTSNRKDGQGSVVIDLDKICTKWLNDKHPDIKIPVIGKQKKSKKSIHTAKNLSPNVVNVQPPKTKNEDLLWFRKIASEEITNYLRKTINDQTITAGDACMSNTETLLKYFTNIKAVGKGSFGTVYTGNIKISSDTFSVAIKESQITKLESKRAKNLEFPIEYFFNQLMNRILNRGLCPSFNYTFCILFCDHCEVFTSFFKRNGNIGRKSKITTCSITMVEKSDSDLKVENDECGQLSALFQILAAVHCIHIIYGIHHRDIKIQNILMKKIPRKKNEYWKYNVDGIDYYVPNAGFIAILNDFGVSNSFSPLISNSDWGVRNAEVIKSGNTFKFKPFKTKEYPQLEKNGKITSIPSPRLRGPGGESLTLNKFWKGFNPDASIDVEISNFQRFPAFSMYQDIQDVIRTFIGGKQTVQPGTHLVMEGLNKRVKDTLLPFDETLAPTSVWPKNRVELFLANKLIHKIFTKFGYNDEPQGAFILETYTLPYKEIK